MQSATLIFYEEDYGELMDLLDQIIQKANDGILGNSRARMVEIQSLAIDAKNRLKEAVLIGSSARK